MSQIKFRGLIKSARILINRHSPEILTSIGIAGMVTTTILAVKATPKALEIIYDHTGRDDNGEYHIPDGVEKIKLCWKCYIPAAVTGALSISCLVGASSVSLKRNAALATAYKLSETMFHEYKEAVLDTVDEVQERVIREKAADKRLEKDPIHTKEVIITNGGDTICYDALSGRYFKSDMMKIKEAMLVVNRLLINENYASLNDFYDELYLDHTNIGDKLGWRIDDGQIDICFDSRIGDDGKPCLVIDYNIAPKYDYYKFA